MKPGDIVRFSSGGFWIGEIRGAVGLVTDVRVNPFGSEQGDIEFDVLVRGRVVKNLLGPFESDIMEVLSEDG